jgi:hypothetical protein
MRTRVAISQPEMRWTTPEHLSSVLSIMGVASELKAQVVLFRKPKNRYRSDHQIQEDSFTEEEAPEMRYQDYLALKEEFSSHTRG